MRGDIIFVSRYSAKSRNPTDMMLLLERRGLYRHYGVDIGDDKVIHFRSVNGEISSSAKIIITSKSEFAVNDTIEKCYRTVYQYSPDEVVQRAYSQLGSNFGRYHLIDNNCEHFARWCASGQRTSTQVLFKSDDQDITGKLFDRVCEPILKASDTIDDVIGWFKKL